MRVLVRVATALVSVAALARLLAARRRASSRRGAPVAGPAVDPAEELRRKLAETRGPDGDELPDPEVSPADDAESRVDLEARRLRVHAKAQEALDAMRSPE